ncbi:TAXI family TRAP transporter solute-binding subunit [Thalassoroseus pseudoceratinae]|uniref:hypothetical protein n=1 Tax=Thalassoroseus pseudoceratinae TaxID=2713176 RepID=UPI00142349CA|nr:hypothetical protein [Thalassoroseus pseudoceratinae]
MSKMIHLRIGPVIERAESLVDRVQQELPTHAGLSGVAIGVRDAAREAEHVARQIRKPWGLHRLPVIFLALTLLFFSLWLYFRFFHVSTLKIALPVRDAVALHDRVAGGGRVKFSQVDVLGSRESVAKLESGEADVAFVQGGISIPRDLPRLSIPNTETLLFFLRDGIESTQDVRKILTSFPDQGSHTVARDIVALWGTSDRVEYNHQWREMTRNPEFNIPNDIDAALVVKDLTSDETLAGIRRIRQAGFRLASTELGARFARLNYITPREIPAGYLLASPSTPTEPVECFTVSAFLVARADLTPRLFAEAAKLLDTNPNTLTDFGFEPTVRESIGMFEGIEAFLSILVYIGLAFLALMGLEVTTYRRRFNELNTLISLISMHQSNKDVLGVQDAERRREFLLYLGLCSDLLGLISVITGYYSQENPSLLYNKLLEIIHHRSSGLKLNIQLKILHAGLSTESLGGQ